MFRGSPGIGSIDSAADAVNSVPTLPAITRMGDTRSLSSITVSPKGTSGYSDAEAEIAGYTQIAVVSNQRLFHKAAPNDFAGVAAAAPTDNASLGWIGIHKEIRAT